MIAPELYRNVFENNPDGQRVLEDLVVRFGAVRFVEGGADADRKQNYALGQSRVVNHILAQIDRAHGADVAEE